MLSLLASNFSLDPDYKVEGAQNVEKRFDEAYAKVAKDPAELAKSVDFIPNQTVTFYTFRLMVAFGIFSAVLALAGIIMLRKGRTSGSGFLKFWSILSLPMPFIAASMGWICTEMGRQPFLVYPIVGNGAGAAGPSGSLALNDIQLSLTTANAVSPSSVVSATSVIITVVCYTLLYAVLAVAWFYLMKRYASKGAPFDEPIPAVKEDLDDSKPLTFSY
jgi:cytochrome d ubiquinol oxidase subunit I